MRESFIGNSTRVRLSALAMTMPSDKRNLLLPNCSLDSKPNVRVRVTVTVTVR